MKKSALRWMKPSDPTILRDYPRRASPAPAQVTPTVLGSIPNVGLGPGDVGSDAFGGIALGYSLFTAPAPRPEVPQPILNRGGRPDTADALFARIEALSASRPSPSPPIT
jgi:hypothetical protein